MSKKLEKNGMWESSRMMLPEHRETILEQNRALKKKVKPDLEEQQQEEVARAIGVSMWLSMPMTFVLFDELQNREIIGTAIKIDTLTRKVKLTGSDGEEWVDFSDIIRIL
ncbi:MAG: hypothetical protein JWM44_2477 [Bacilli bacterium]|nr:hypothetical protein [Bacilli bacterium]